MKLKRNVLLILCCWSIMGTALAQSQELKVEGMEVSASDLSGSTQRRLDDHQKPCALVKIRLTGNDAQIDGEFVGMVEHKSGEYWVYLPQSSSGIGVSCPGFKPLDIEFNKYGIKELKPLTTYLLTITRPTSGRGILNVGYTPADAEVWIDGQRKGVSPQRFTMTAGEHRVEIKSTGYISRLLTVNINGGEITDLNGMLEIDKTAPMLTFSVKGIKFNMIRVDGGTFNMGRTKDMEKEVSWEKPYNQNLEKPVHKVTLTDYYIGETEVTEALWNAVTGEGKTSDNAATTAKDNVTWEQCQEFVDELSSLLGMPFSLPTEAQWEFAARGGNKDIPSIFSGSDDYKEVARVRGNNYYDPKSIMCFKPNELGIYDMTGNVCEWCYDFFSLYSKQDQTDPTGPEKLLPSEKGHIFRGGSTITIPVQARISARERYSTGITVYMGLRLALKFK